MKRIKISIISAISMFLLILNMESKAQVLTFSNIKNSTNNKYSVYVCKTGIVFNLGDTITIGSPSLTGKFKWVQPLIKTLNSAKYLSGKNVIISSITIYDNVVVFKCSFNIDLCIDLAMGVDEISSSYLLKRIGEGIIRDYNKEIRLGMSINSVKLFIKGEPTSVKVSDYGRGKEYQYCWNNNNGLQCFYCGEDGFITAYN